MNYVGSLKEIQQLFEQRADVAMRESNKETSVRYKSVRLGESNCWREAAMIIRNTKLVADQQEPAWQTKMKQCGWIKLENGRIQHPQHPFSYPSWEIALDLCIEMESGV